MRYLYVANWKMNMNVSKSINFCSQNYNTLQQLSVDADIVLCPSFIALIPVIEALKNNPVAIGAQNCSEYSLGAYTGEVSALSLTEIGVKYCIVGHSERRVLYHETTEAIIKKIYLLYAANIVPIICIGETHENFLNKKTFEVLTEQLNPILTAIAEQQEHSKHLIIAYEPVWSIGTNIIPTQQQLAAVFAWITEQIKLHLPEHTLQLLYGGSVSKDTIKELKKTPLINGFLIGGASTDFEQFNDIING
jgi:triosephosphate isomerase (TIM)